MRQSGRHAGRWRRSRPCWSTRGLKELHPEAQEVRLIKVACVPPPPFTLPHLISARVPHATAFLLLTVLVTHLPPCHRRDFLRCIFLFVPCRAQPFGLVDDEPSSTC